MGSHIENIPFDNNYQKVYSQYEKLQYSTPPLQIRKSQNKRQLNAYNQLQKNP